MKHIKEQVIDAVNTGMPDALTSCKFINFDNGFGAQNTQKFGPRPSRNEYYKSDTCLVSLPQRAW